MSSDLKARTREKLADDIRKTMAAAISGQPENDIYERCQIVASRIELLIDATILEEKRLDLGRTP